MKEIKVAATIIHLPATYVLHHRKPGVDIGEEGKFGLYGGQIEEEDLDAQHAASRELEEESGVSYPPEGFGYLGFVHVRSERNGEEVLTGAEIFSIILPGDFSVDRFNNGVRMSPRELSRAKALGQLSSVASVSFGKFMGV